MGPGRVPRPPRLRCCPSSHQLPHYGRGAIIAAGAATPLHGTGEIDDGRHICGLLVRAWYQALCQNAAGKVVARQGRWAPARCATWTASATSACKEMLHPGSRFQMAGELLETYLLWLIEAHACVGGRPRAHPARATQNAAIGTRRQRNRRTRGRVPRPGGRDPGHQAHDRRAAPAGLPAGDGKENRRPGVRCRGLPMLLPEMPKSACRASRRRPAPASVPLTAGTSPARADRQLRPRAAASPIVPASLVGAEHRTAPAARADRLDSALAQLLDGGGMLHGDRVSYR